MRHNGSMSKPSPLPPRAGVDATRLHLPATGGTTSVSEYLISRFKNTEARSILNRFELSEIVDANGRAVRADEPIDNVRTIWFYRDLPDETHIPFEPRILHQDDHLLVVDKPHFLATTPSGMYVRNSALVRLRESLRNDDLAPIHRLDRQTAGVLLFSTKPGTRGRYQQLFAKRQVCKVYEAQTHLPEGWNPQQPSLAGNTFPFTVRSHLHKERRILRVQEVPGLPPNAETKIELISFDDKKLHLRLYPRTGQMHQLRVQLASLGAGILNDPFYPDLVPSPADDYANPMALVATQISFTDPLNGQLRRFTSRIQSLVEPGGNNF